MCCNGCHTHKCYHPTRFIDADSSARQVLSGVHALLVPKELLKDHVHLSACWVCDFSSTEHSFRLAGLLCLLFRWLAMSVDGQL